MIRKHLISREVPYVLLAFAGLALVLLVANVIILETPAVRYDASRVQPAQVIRPEERAALYWQVEADRWNAMAEHYARNLRPLTASDRYGHNLTGEAIPGRLQPPTGFVGDAIPYQAKPWIRPAPVIGVPRTALDRYGHNLTGEVIPGQLQAGQPMQKMNETLPSIERYAAGLSRTWLAEAARWSAMAEYYGRMNVNQQLSPLWKTQAEQAE